MVWVKPPLDVPTLESATTSRSPLGSAVERVTSNDKVVSSTLAVGISFCSGGDALQMSFCSSLPVLFRPRAPFSIRGHRSLSAGTVGTHSWPHPCFTPPPHGTTCSDLPSLISLAGMPLCPFRRLSGWSSFDLGCYTSLNTGKYA